MLLLLYTYWTPLLTLELYLVALPWLAWMCVCFEVPSYLGWCLTLAYIPGTLPWCHPSQWCLTLGPCISSPGGVKASEPASSPPTLSWYLVSIYSLNEAGQCGHFWA